MWKALFGGSRAVDIDDAAWAAVLARSTLFGQLHPTVRDRLRERVGEFLARKSFSAAGEHSLDDSQCLAIAAMACLPVVELGIDSMDGWSEIIVYPDAFRVRREDHDEESGVVTEGEDELIGEAWERGPVILSWADVEADLDHPFDGCNVVIHEIAHKLDMLDGAMNGVPRLPPWIDRKRWVETMQLAYDELVKQVDDDRETVIDPYAAESVEEFFAVVSETHFSTPRLLTQQHAALAQLLGDFYGKPVRETG
ncbi:MAG: M90 family metallopeptidase [Dokdonella sp.]